MRLRKALRPRLTAFALRGDVFVLAVWALSRALVVGGALFLARSHFNWVANWDGAWFEKIAAAGYSYAPGGYSSVAFFPLYPLTVRFLMFGGIPFDVAGAIVSNAAFLAMLGVVFGWTRTRLGVVQARWSIAVLAFFPLSLFCSVAYSEALFMLLSALALRDFDRAVYGRAALWTALASLTRPSGLWLLPAFALAAIFERRKAAALLCALASAAGVVTMGTYYGVRFADPLAEFHAEAYWRYANGSAWAKWSVLLARGTYSFQHWRVQLEVIPAAILIFFYKRLPPGLVLLMCAIVVYREHWAWDRDFPTAVIVVVGGAALWYFRKGLGTAPVAYGFVGLLSLLVSGGPLSVDRLLYGVLPFSIAIGCFFAELPYAGVPLLASFCFDLVRVTGAFIRSEWVA